MPKHAHWIHLGLRGRGGRAALGIGGLAVLTAVGLYGRPVQACGGFFCNQPGNPFDPPPVAQTAENVLFAVNAHPAPGEAKLEAHIQIFYTGPAAKFSWVLPVDAQPTLDVGSDEVFTTLEQITRPQFRLNAHDEGTCMPSPYFGIGGDGKGVLSGPGAAVPPSANGVDVSFRGAVGPFDAAVIHSSDPEQLKVWLRMNDYFISDKAGALIDDYVRIGKYFVALKLLNGMDVQSIRPIILRFDGPSPCIPLRLTAIAAVNDLRVNLWVLADSRTVPFNFLEITVNQVKLNWFDGGGNYDALLKQAANEAGGNAFTAEYAGTARIMDRQIWFDGRFNLPKLRAAMTPPAYLNELGAQGFARDAKLLALLEKYIPEPASLVQMGVPERTFYNQLSTYWQTIGNQFAPFSPGAFTDELEQTIVLPLQAAQGLFDRQSYMTRLATFISPEEMNVDPVFVFNNELGDVPVVRQADATYECGDMMYSRCTAPVRLRLPNGTTVRLLPSASPMCSYAGPTYQRSDLDALPAAEAMWQRAAAGPGNAVGDNTPTIDKTVGLHNQGTYSGCACSVGTDPAGAFGGSMLLAFGIAAGLLRRSRRRKARD